MKQWHMIIDIAKCEDCNNCLLACKDEHVDNDWPGYSAPQPRHGHRWIDVARKERGQFPLIDVAYRPTTCMHCADAPCVPASAGAIKRRDDGIVLIDPKKSKGMRHMVDSCPYGQISWNDAEQVPQKCTFCAHLLDQGWTKPRCVQACPTGALTSICVDDAELTRMVEEKKLAQLHPEFNTRPQVFYANLYRFDSCFIAGSIAKDDDGTVDCASGAKVTLKQGKKVVAETTTDAFGDFKFDHLEPNRTWYTVQVELPDHESREYPIQKLEESLNIGTLCLHPAQKEVAASNKP